MHKQEHPNETPDALMESPGSGVDEVESVGEVFARLGPAGYLAIGWAALPVLGSVLLWLNIGSIARWLVDHEQLGVVLYVLIFVVSAGFGVLPTYVQAILAGWAFGVTVGVPAAIAGVTGAAVVGYVTARLA